MYDDTVAVLFWPRCYYPDDFRYYIRVQSLQLTCLAANGVGGRLGPTGVTSGGDAGSLADTAKTDTVAGIITALERSASSLSEGVMVVATGDVWSGEDDAPSRLLRTLQPSGHEQPVYTVDVDHLLADGRHGTAPADTVDAVGRPLPAVCARPADPTHQGTATLLPPQSRYVVLFRDGPGPRSTPDPFGQLASLNRTFWDTDVYYVIVTRQFDPVARQTVYAAWRDLSIYKYAIVAVRLFCSIYTM